VRDALRTKDQVLRAIHQLQRRSSTKLARTSDLATLLRIKEPSVTARLQELAMNGLVRYQPRRGATLTTEGERIAAHCTARIQNIERFLSAVFRLPAGSATEDAERVARFVSDRVMNGIVQYLASV